jgi:hypothetical protein
MAGCGVDGAESLCRKTVSRRCSSLPCLDVWFWVHYEWNGSLSSASGGLSLSAAGKPRGLRALLSGFPMIGE